MVNAYIGKVGLRANLGQGRPAYRWKTNEVVFVAELTQAELELLLKRLAELTEPKEDRVQIFMLHDFSNPWGWGIWCRWVKPAWCEAMRRYVLNSPALTDYGVWRFAGPIAPEVARAWAQAGFVSAVGHEGRRNCWAVFYANPCRRTVRG